MCGLAFVLNEVGRAAERRGGNMARRVVEYFI